MEWHLRKVNLKVNLFDLYLHDGDDCFGFTLLEFNRDWTPYALLAFEFKLPNGTTRKRLKITNWDLLFIATPAWQFVDHCREQVRWGRIGPTGARRILYNTLTKLF
jgi:hypothetical protein